MTPSSETNDVLLDAAANPFGLRLELREEGLECYASVPAADGAGESLSVADLTALLQRHGIVHGVRDEAVTAFCEAEDPAYRATPRRLAMGDPPATGADGRLELTAHDSQHERFQEDATGHVDLRSLHLFDNVEAEQQLGRILPPQLGAAGTTVTGRVIPGLTGRALDLTLGEGVRLDADSGELFATRAGRIVRSSHGLAVSEDYVVEGDVDLAVGHIHFSGFVRISGDVLDGFHIHATKGLVVGGNVGACLLESDGDITLGGMAGQGKGHLRCGGTLTAHYLNEATVECDGDVRVQNEIRNSTVKAGGAIRIPEGIIIGGECVALRGIEARRLGTPGGVRGRLLPGVDFRLLDRQRFLNDRRHALDGERSHILHLVGNMRERLGDPQASPPNIRRLLERYEGLENTLEVVEGELAQCHPDGHPAAVPQVNVKDLLNEGTVITIGACTLDFPTEQQGPLSVVLDAEEGLITCIPLRSLSDEEESSS